MAEDLPDGADPDAPPPPEMGAGPLDVGDPPDQLAHYEEAENLEPDQPPADVDPTTLPMAD